MSTEKWKGLVYCTVRNSGGSAAKRKSNQYDEEGNTMWKKRLVSMAMALLLAVSLLPTAAWAAYSVGTLDDLKRQLSYGETRTITVTGTIEVTETLVIPAKANITITGGGTLKRAASFTNNSMFYARGYSSNSKAGLTLENITVDGGKVEASDSAFEIGGDSFLTLKNGAVIQNHVCTSAYEGTVYVAGGVLTMEAVALSGITPPPATAAV